MAAYFLMADGVPAHPFCEARGAWPRLTPLKANRARRPADGKAARSCTRPAVCKCGAATRLSVHAQLWTFDWSMLIGCSQ